MTHCQAAQKEDQPVSFSNPGQEGRVWTKVLTGEDGDKSYWHCEMIGVGVFLCSVAIAINYVTKFVKLTMLGQMLVYNYKLCMYIKYR